MAATALSASSASSSSSAPSTTSRHPPVSSTSDREIELGKLLSIFDSTLPSNLIRHVFETNSIQSASKLLDKLARMSERMCLPPTVDDAQARPFPSLFRHLQWSHSFSTHQSLLIDTPLISVSLPMQLLHSALVEFFAVVGYANIQVPRFHVASGPRETIEAICASLLSSTQPPPSLLDPPQPARSSSVAKSKVRSRTPPPHLGGHLEFADSPRHCAC